MYQLESNVYGIGGNISFIFSKITSKLVQGIKLLIYWTA